MSTINNFNVPYICPNAHKPDRACKQDSKSCDHSYIHEYTHLCEKKCAGVKCVSVEIRICSDKECILEESKKTYIRGNKCEHSVPHRKKRNCTDDCLVNGKECILFEGQMGIKNILPPRTFKARATAKATRYHMRNNNG